MESNIIYSFSYYVNHNLGVFRHAVFSLRIFCAQPLKMLKNFVYGRFVFYRPDRILKKKTLV